MISLDDDIIIAGFAPDDLEASVPVAPPGAGGGCELRSECVSTGPPSCDSGTVDCGIRTSARVSASSRGIPAAYEKPVGIGSGRSGAAHHGVVVIEEIPSGNLLSPKIPNGCDPMGFAD